MSAAFVNISYENKRFINGWKFTSSAFEITGDVSRNSRVGDVFSIEISCHHLVPFLLQLQFCFPWLPRNGLLLPSALMLLLWKWRARSKGFLFSSNFRKTSFELFFYFTDSVKWPLNSFLKIFSSLVRWNSALFFSMFFASWREHTLERMLYL